MIHSQEVPRVISFTEGRWLPGTGEGPTGSYCFMDTEFQFGKMQKFERESGHDCEGCE